jgi:hypothetical protein
MTFLNGLVIGAVSALLVAGVAMHFFLETVRR